MRNPNGYGSVYKLSGKRRKPWIVRVPNGYDENGKLIRLCVGYASTKAEALQMLADYNKMPYNVDASKLPFSKIYEKWFSEKCKHIKESSATNYTNAYHHCAALYDRAIKDIKTADIQSVIDNIEASAVAEKTLMMINQIFKYCLANDIVKKNYAEAVKIAKKSKNTKRNKSVFTEEEISSLWEHWQDIEEQYILIQIYTGVRIGELLNLKKEDIHLDKHYLTIRESKTENGIRDVPIHPRIEPLIQSALVRSKNEFLVTSRFGNQYTYINFNTNYFLPCMKKYGFDHTTHECRHTFISRATIAGCNPTFIRKIVGHDSLMTLAERTYTHIGIEDLYADICKIP